MTVARRALLAAVLALAAGVALPTAAGAADPVITADFAKKRSDLPSLNGVLHGMGNKNPSDERITPLQPGLWRAIPSSAPFQRATGFGARYTVRVRTSDVNIVKNVAELTVKDVRLHEAFLLTLSAMPRA